MQSDNLVSALRVIATADASAFNDAEYLRAMLTDVAPGLCHEQVELCAQAVRFRLPDLLRSNPGQPVEYLTGMLATRMGVLDAPYYRDVVAAFAGALAPAPQPAMVVAAPAPVPQSPVALAPTPQPPTVAAVSPPVQQPWQQVGFPPPPVQRGGARKKVIAAIAGAAVVAGGVTVVVVLGAGGASQLAAPLGVHTQVSSTGVTVSWTPVKGAKSYQLLRDGTQVSPTSHGATEVVDTAVNTGRSHVYVVKAVDDHGHAGRASQSVSSLTLAQTVAALTARVSTNLIASGSCVEQTSDEKNSATYGDTELACRPVMAWGVQPSRIYIFQYPTRADLQRKVAIDENTIPWRTDNVCSTATTSDKGSWNKHGVTPKQQVGELYCFHTPNNVGVLTWTYDDQAVRIQVEGDGMRISDLRTWWFANWDNDSLALTS